jgi:hypothetical protein
MTTAMAVAAAIAFSFALGSLARYVDGSTLRRWRLSRRWDVSRLAREFITAADEPLASLRGLMHMINAWERGARRPSERYWLLYLRVFPECWNGETTHGSPNGTGALPAAAEIDAMETATPDSANGAAPQDIRTLAAAVRALEQQIAGLSKRLDELSRHKNGEIRPRARRNKRPGISGTWTILRTALVPSI